MEISNLDLNTYKKLDQILKRLEEDIIISGRNFVKLCGNSKRARAYAEIFEDHNLAIVAKTEKEPGIFQLRATNSIPVFLKSGGFTEKYITNIAKKYFDLLVSKYGVNIPASAIQKYADEHPKLPDLLKNIVNQNGYNISSNNNAREIISHELEDIDEVPYSMVISLATRYFITITEVQDFLRQDLKLVNINEQRGIPLYQRENLDIEHLYDELDKITDKKIDRTQKTLTAIASEIQILTGKSYPALLSYREISDDINRLTNSSQNETTIEKKNIEELNRTNEESSTKQAAYLLSQKKLLIRDQYIRSCFDVKDIAEVYSDHINDLSTNESGQMIGVFGKWGRGKTYFVKELCEQLSIDYQEEKGKDKFHFVRFQAWKYQDTPAIWAYLYETLSAKYLGTNKISQLFKRIWLNLNNVGFLSFLKDFSIVVISWIAFISSLNLFQLSDSSAIKYIISFTADYANGIIGGGTVITLLIRFYKKQEQTAHELIKKYSKGITFSKHLGIQAEIEKELVTLLKTWIPCPNEKRLLLFVDDIDRCSEDKIVQLVDALRVMLEHSEIIKRVIVLVAIDEEKLKMAIRHKYKTFFSDYSKENHTKLSEMQDEYLDKLFISGIKLQSLNISQVDEYISELVAENWKNKSTSPSDRKLVPAETLIPSELNSDSEIVTPNIEQTDTLKEKYFIDLNSDDEMILIQTEVRHFKNKLTPRQIRIFYYRFQLAMNLYMRLTKTENNQIPTPDLSILLSAIRERTENINPTQYGNKIINEIADLVVGY